MTQWNSEGRGVAVELHRAFSASSYGETLQGKPRWDMQRPPHIEPHEWIALLGRDADNLEHMKLTLDITNLFIHYDDGSLKINNDEARLLQRAAIMHDWGECYDESGNGGDINYEFKTADNIATEMERFRQVYAELVPDGDVKEKFILESIIFKRDTKLGQIFDAIERVGYLRTGLNAARLAQGVDDPILASHLQWLAAGTLANQMIPLMEYAANYTPVRKYLEVVSDEVDTAFATLPVDTFAEHGQTQLEKKYWFNQARTAWKHGSSQNQAPKPRGNITQDRDRPNFEGRYVRDYETLATKIEACRTLGMQIVLTSGSFDLMHIGHMRYIERAKEYGDILVVGVDSDSKIQRRKGPDRPVVDETERMQMLSHTRGVDFIALKQPTDQKWELIKTVHPDILIATAETYTPEEIAELEADYCGRVVVLEPQATTSTSARIRKLNIGGLREVIRPLLDEMSTGTTIDVVKERLERVANES